MQNERLSKVRLLPWLAGWLLLSLAAGHARAEGPATESAKAHTPASNIEGWYEDESEDDPKGNWTWFGMGYESRISGNNATTAAGSRAGAVGAAGVGGAAAVMTQRGPGRR